MLLLENFEDVEKNKFIIGKANSVREKINNLCTDNINDNTVIKFLTFFPLGG